MGDIGQVPGRYLGDIRRETGEISGRSSADELTCAAARVRRSSARREAAASPPAEAAAAAAASAASRACIRPRAWRCRGDAGEMQGRCRGGVGEVYGEV